MRSVKFIPIIPIKLYQILISPLFPPVCRFCPTCSQYAIQAFAKYGIFKGGWISLKRLCRCHPYHRGGYDPLV
ncbi:TPA: membrane protein insertion efficiency factor YidD [Candidatus Poribacteria bacterium]|nr:membrane protein insertion efficiency factor YidD [Candidatus Poribacteria bacterium]HIB88615.1 membrane protein insertion efficiency factor YidD [Candidatus Poribacteria bacterium]HIC01233.1 membrane protein insertion efficiency factor YidD [Candidatus Poribacteria bacterium]HIM09366.1 membrane protein insertion efficiency factor YidD [Candidatus Poribacteria bacterium]HIN29161.1 membrane protein insertion efficiency factor YidD [Candidatus Poribacteria bacterium]